MRGLDKVIGGSGELNNGNGVLRRLHIRYLQAVSSINQEIRRKWKLVRQIQDDLSQQRNINLLTFAGLMLLIIVVSAVAVMIEADR